MAGAGRSRRATRRSRRPSSRGSPPRDIRRSSSTRLPARRSRSTRCRSGVTTIAARPSRCRSASRRKSSSSPGFCASPPLGRAACPQLSEVRPSGLRLDRADAARRGDASGPRPAAPRRRSSSASLAGAVYFALTLYWLVETMTTFGGLARAGGGARRWRAGGLPGALSRRIRADPGAHLQRASGLGPAAGAGGLGRRRSWAASTCGTAFPGCSSATAR